MFYSQSWEIIIIQPSQPRARDKSGRTAGETETDQIHQSSIVFGIVISPYFLDVLKLGTYVVRIDNFYYKCIIKRLYLDKYRAAVIQPFPSLHLLYVIWSGVLVTGVQTPLCVQVSILYNWEILLLTANTTGLYLLAGQMPYY